MEISPIPTLSKEINNIREATASIVADQIIPNESKIYKGGKKAKGLRAVSYTHLTLPTSV